MTTAGKSQPPNQRLGSWKEIAAFFDCDERTLRRWEKERGLPIHRAPGGVGGKVFAYTDELSSWLAAPRNLGPDLPKNGAAVESEAEGISSPIAFIDGGLAEGRRPEGRTEEDFAVLTIQPRASEKQPAISRWKTAGLLVAATLVVAVLSLALLYRRPDPDSVAVLPFTNGGGDANTDYLSDGITESLIDNLTRVPQLKVRSRNSAFRYKEKDLDVRQVGSDLGVSVVVTGRVVPQGDDIEVSAELTDVRDNTELWGQHYHSKIADIIGLQQRIAGDIAEKLRSKISASEKQEVTRQRTQNPQAYELYLRGRYAWNKRTPSDLNAAISYFNQAISKDPGYAMAYSGLADVYYVRLPVYSGAPSENDPKAAAAAHRALELDTTLARPHAVLGGTEMEYDWDFAGGESEYKKAFELDPNDATAHEWYAEKIGMIGGREQEALAEMNRAHQLDPLSSVISSQVGDVHVMARRFDDAIVVCRKLAGEDQTFARAHKCLAQAYWGKRMFPDVIKEWTIFGQLSRDPNESEFATALEEGFHSAGWKGALTRGIEVREGERKTGYSSAYGIATLYADLGDKDQAFRWLDTAYQERDWLLESLGTDFLLDPIRSDPRFTELVRKVGLPR